MRLNRLLMAVVGALAVSGCAIPKLLIADGFTGGRSDRAVLIPAATLDNKQVVYDYILRICDYDAQGNESNCTDTKVLGNVVSETVY